MHTSCSEEPVNEIEDVVPRHYLHVNKRELHSSLTQPACIITASSSRVVH